VQEEISSGVEKRSTPYAQGASAKLSEKGGIYVPAE
jgi:hypothetical protein